MTDEHLCPTCGSSGYIEGPDPGWYETPCPDCRGTGIAGPTPEEVASLLRSVEFAMSHGRSAMVAFFDTKYGTSAIERDYERMKEVERQVKAMLDRLPPEPPMTPEHMEKVGAVVSAALRKRFGEGTAEELDAAVEAAWPDPEREASWQPGRGQT